MTAPERIFHIATHADWSRALETGRYTTSTVGRTLEEEGFVHACRRDQVGDVFERHYAGVREPLVLLTIAPERLEAEVRDEPVGQEVYPHVYGAVTPAAVVEAQPLDHRGDPATFLGVFLGGVAARMGAAVLVMALGLVALAVAAVVTTAPGVQLGALLGGMLVGALAITVLARRQGGPPAHP